MKATIPSRRPNLDKQKQKHPICPFTKEEQEDFQLKQDARATKWQFLPSKPCFYNLKIANNSYFQCEKFGYSKRVVRLTICLRNETINNKIQFLLKKNRHKYLQNEKSYLFLRCTKFMILKSKLPYRNLKERKIKD